jgi:site-specific DNA-methyltransferase (adenine-specific)
MFWIQNPSTRSVRYRCSRGEKRLTESGFVENFVGVDGHTKIVKKRGRPQIHENAAARWRAYYRRKKKAEQVARRKRKDEWETPDCLFKKYDAKFGGFALDAAANLRNFKCTHFYSLEAGQDGLSLPWLSPTWVNPPFSEIGKWVKKASDEASRGITSVMLIKSSTGASYWHEWIWKKPDVEIELLDKRVTFVGAPDPAKFDCVIVIFRGKDSR